MPAIAEIDWSLYGLPQYTDTDLTSATNTDLKKEPGISDVNGLTEVSLLGAVYGLTTQENLGSSEVVAAAGAAMILGGGMEYMRNYMSESGKAWESWAYAALIYGGEVAVIYYGWVNDLNIMMVSGSTAFLGSFLTWAFVE